MLSLAQNIWWPYIHRDRPPKTIECNGCKDNGNNIKLVIPPNKWSPLPNCVEPNDELQTDFCGPFTNERRTEQYFLTGIDRYVKYPAIEIVNNASSQT